jgi:hypothetical protein
MVKALKLIRESIRETRHLGRQMEQRPLKSQRNRYERRKVKECLRLGDWGAEAEA